MRGPKLISKGFTPREQRGTGRNAREILCPYWGRGAVPSRQKGAGRVRKWHVRGQPANNTASLPPLHSCHTPVLLSLFLAQLVAQETHRLSTCQESRSVYLRSQALAVTFTHSSYCDCWKGWAQTTATASPRIPWEVASCGLGVSVNSPSLSQVSP